MPRAKKPVTAADCVDPVALIAPAVTEVLDNVQGPVLAAAQRLLERTTLRYSAADMEKLDQFAIGLLGPNTGAGYSSDEIFMSRVRAAYLRAEVVLTVRKEIAALYTESGASDTGKPAVGSVVIVCGGIKATVKAHHPDGLVVGAGAGYVVNEWRASE